MIDDDDVSWAAILFSDFSGPIGAILFVVVVSFFAYSACENEKECAQKTCPSGKAPRLMDHGCLCVEEAK